MKLKDLRSRVRGIQRDRNDVEERNQGLKTRVRLLERELQWRKRKECEEEERKGRELAE